MFSQLFREVFETLVAAQFFREFVVKLRLHPCLNALDLNFVRHRFTCKALLPEIPRIGYFELELLAGFGSAQRVGESLDGIFAADFDGDVFALNGLRRWRG